MHEHTLAEALRRWSGEDIQPAPEISLPDRMGARVRCGEVIPMNGEHAATVAARGRV